MNVVSGRIPAFLVGLMGLAACSETVASSGAALDVAARSGAGSDASLADGVVPPGPAADAQSGAPSDTAPELAAPVRTADGGVAKAPCQCGDGACDLSCEDPWTCPSDCKGTCGNGACEPGENPMLCKADCCGTCGDGKCVGGACGEATTGGPSWCAADCGTACGNKVCDPGETTLACPEDCEFKACGNGVCEGGEDPKACAADCGPTCGDCVCAKGEGPIDCPVDCGSCGDGVCRCAPLGSSGVTEKDVCAGDCSQVACQPGKDNAACADANPCTLDTCDKASGCKKTLLDTGPCDDKSACTAGDHCDDGTCGGAPLLWNQSFTAQGASLEPVGVIAVETGGPWAGFLLVGTHIEPGTPPVVRGFKARVADNGVLLWNFPIFGDKPGQLYLTTAARSGPEQALAGGYRRYCDPDGISCNTPYAQLVEVNVSKPDTAKVLSLWDEPAQVIAIAERGANESVNVFVGTAASPNAQKAMVPFGFFGRWPWADNVTPKPEMIKLEPPDGSVFTPTAVCHAATAGLSYVTGTKTLGPNKVVTSHVVRVAFQMKGAAVAPPADVIKGWTDLGDVLALGVVCLPDGAALALGRTPAVGKPFGWVARIESSGAVGKTAQVATPSIWRTGWAGAADGSYVVVGGEDTAVNKVALTGIDANLQPVWSGTHTGFGTGLPQALQAMRPGGQNRWLLAAKSYGFPYSVAHLARVDSFVNATCGESATCYGMAGQECNDGNACTVQDCQKDAVCSAKDLLTGVPCGTGGGCAAGVCK